MTAQRTRGADTYSAAAAQAVRRPDRRRRNQRDPTLPYINKLKPWTLSSSGALRTLNGPWLATALKNSELGWLPGHRY